MNTSRPRRFDSIDDRSISGNPFDSSKWTVKRRSRGWVVLDGNGNPIHKAPTKAAATGWCHTMALVGEISAEDPLIDLAAKAKALVAKAEDEQRRGIPPAPARPGESAALRRYLKVDTGPFNFAKKPSIKAPPHPKDARK